MDSLIFFSLIIVNTLVVSIIFITFAKNKNYINHGTRKEIF